MKSSQRKAMFAHMNGAINFKCLDTKSKFSEFFVRPTNTDLINNHKLGIGYQGPEMSARPKKKKR